MMRTLPFAACYVYSPLGQGPSSQRSRLLRALLKSGDVRFLQIYAERVRSEVCARASLAEFFAAAPLLVPVPGSSPRRDQSRAVTELLAGALRARGLGSDVWPMLRRVSAVPKSATCQSCRRPTVAVHYQSFEVDWRSTMPTEILLVDDVVTKGRTLLAAATRLQEAFPSSRIRAFALLRTLGMAAGVERLVDPCVGQIRWRAGDAHRSP